MLPARARLCSSSLSVSFDSSSSVDLFSGASLAGLAADPFDSRAEVSLRRSRPPLAARPVPLRLRFAQHHERREGQIRASANLPRRKVVKAPRGRMWLRWSNGESA